MAPAQRTARPWEAIAVRWAVLLVIVVAVLSSNPTVWTLVMLAVAASAWLAWSWFDPRAHRLTAAMAFTFGLVGAVLAGLGLPSVGIPFACAAALFVSSRVDFMTALSLDLALALTVFAAGVPAGRTFGEMSTSASAIAVGWAVGNGRRTRTLRAEAAEALLQETIRANEGQAQAAALAERARIAREIHDVLAHSLSALTLQLDAVDALLTDGRDPERAHEMVLRARRTARDGLDESRRAVSALRNDVKPLDEMLATLVDDFRTDTGAEAKLTAEGDAASVPVETAQALQRVVREALTNVRKHAAGATAEVRLTVGADGAARVEIENSAGRGADAGIAPGGGYGLVGLRERVELLGGTVTAGVTAGGGWVVAAEMPSALG